MNKILAHTALTMENPIKRIKELELSSGCVRKQKKRALSVIHHYIQQRSACMEVARRVHLCRNITF